VLAGTDLTLWRGTTRLFEGLSFELPPGGALMIEGPNGAGKTTLLRVIAGLTMPESGIVTWVGSASGTRYRRACCVWRFAATRWH
jgi:heme exporter protein A